MSVPTDPFFDPKTTSPWIRQDIARAFLELKNYEKMVYFISAAIRGPRMKGKRRMPKKEAQQIAERVIDVLPDALGTRPMSDRKVLWDSVAR